jgi:hypothetical protein
VLITVQTVGVAEVTANACPKLLNPPIFEISTKETAASTVWVPLPTIDVDLLIVIFMAALIQLKDL